MLRLFNREFHPSVQGSELELRDLLENLPVPAYTCNSDGLITYFNQHAVRIWGRAPKLNDPEDRFCGSFMLLSESGSAISDNECCMALALQTGKEYSGQEVVIQWANGRRISALVYAKPVQNGFGIVGAVGILVDISAQKDVSQSLREEMIQCRRLEQKFFERAERQHSRITHHLQEDLAQQLTGMSLLVRVLHRQLNEDSNIEEGRIVELAKLASESIATARNLAKGSYPLEVDHGGLLYALQELANQTETQNNVSCKLLYDSAFRCDHGAAIYLYRIAQELIDNAIKHACARNIVIECKVRNGMGSLAVSNDGVPLKYLLDGPNEVDFDLIHSRVRLIGARLEIQESSEIGYTVICWLDS